MDVDESDPQVIEARARVAAKIAAWQQCAPAAEKMAAAFEGAGSADRAAADTTEVPPA